MHNSKGFLLIKLVMPIIPTVMSIEHGVDLVSHDSAPKNIEFWGSNSTDIRPNNAQQLGKRLVRGKYDIARYKKGQRLQDYNNAEPVPVKYILYRILDNYGADYTCTYRVRVHGVPIDKAA